MLLVSIGCMDTIQRGRDAELVSCGGLQMPFTFISFMDAIYALSPSKHQPVRGADQLCGSAVHRGRMH